MPLIDDVLQPGAEQVELVSSGRLLRAHRRLLITGAPTIESPRPAAAKRKAHLQAFRPQDDSTLQNKILPGAIRPLWHSPFRLLHGRLAVLISGQEELIGQLVNREKSFEAGFLRCWRIGCRVMACSLPR